MEAMAEQPPTSQPDQPAPALSPAAPPPPIITPNSATIALDPNSNALNINAASLRGSPSDRIIKPRPRKDSLQSISGSDSVPGRVQKPRARKSPGSGAKRSEPSKRKFICSFSHYGCDVALSSKNEWKRHVSIQHLQLGFYRCDVGSCNPDANPNAAGSKRVYNDFNRKDLFTQHHRRMHKPESGPGSGTSPTTGNENSKDWRAFEDSLEEVRSRCWHERRKPPLRSTCGFCGRIFEGDGSWNERMEHVGGHFSRDIPEACKEEREDEDLTSWALKEGIIKELGNGRHGLVDQPPTAAERPYMSRDRDVNMMDAPPVTPTQANGNSSHDEDSEMDGTRRLSGSYQNGSGQLSSREAQMSPDSRRGYNVAPPPLRPYAFGDKEETSDRLEELVNTLLQPKPPKSIRRFSWKCDCNLELAVDLDSNDERAIATLGKLSVICKNASTAYLKNVNQNGYSVISCDEIAPYIRREGHHPIELHMPTIQETMEAPMHTVNANAQASANAAAIDVASAANAAMDATAKMEDQQGQQA